MENNFCKSCAIGNVDSNFPHTTDKNTCKIGRFLWYRSLDNKKQMDELKKTEILIPQLAEKVEKISKETGEAPMDILIALGFEYI